VRRLQDFTPRIGIILGSGLGGLADALENSARFPYADLDGFPQPTVAGHGGTLHMGELNGLPVAVFQGRKHIYEGGDPGAMRVPIRVLKQLGAETLLVTNAAGSLRAEVGPGRLMAISDHINALGVNPLTGPNDDAIGPRFPSLRDAYDPELRALLRSAARSLGIALAEGVYAAMPGPTYETPAEVRMLHVLGADAVGMSTVPEVCVARHMGARVIGISCITNQAAGITGQPLSHDEVTATAARVRATFEALLDAALAALVAHRELAR
jgi:xanthosine phosphorylase